MTHGTISRGHSGRVTADVSHATRAAAQLGRASRGVTATLRLGGH